MCMLADKIDRKDLAPFIQLSDKWVSEIKYDGIRLRVRISNYEMKFYNRKGKDVTEQYPDLQFSILRKIPLSRGSCNTNNFIKGVKDCFLDGELCVFDSDGTSQFNTGISFRTHCKTTTSIFSSAEKYPVTLALFDILELDGKDLRNLPLSGRRRVLESLQIVTGNKSCFVVEQYSNGMTMKLWNECTSKGREGIVLKHSDSVYREGYRCSNWRKVKNVKETDLLFNKYEVHNMGVTVENDDGIRVVVNGHQSGIVKSRIDSGGSVLLTIRHLGVTETGKYRQPVMFKIAEV